MPPRKAAPLPARASVGKPGMIVVMINAIKTGKSPSLKFICIVAIFFLLI
jgi:hypothetical protein